jgi:hypothetical protein
MSPTEGGQILRREGREESRTTDGLCFSRRYSSEERHYKPSFVPVYAPSDPGRPPATKSTKTFWPQRAQRGTLVTLTRFFVTKTNFSALVSQRPRCYDTKEHEASPLKPTIVIFVSFVADRLRVLGGHRPLGRAVVVDALRS